MLARAERERRTARDAPPSAPPSPAPQGLTARELQHTLLARLDATIALLERPPTKRKQSAIHDARKTIKRLRALLRLLRAELGPRRYAAADLALRECAQRLAIARDAEVMVLTLDELVRRHPGELAGRGGVRKLRAALLAERERVGASANDDRDDHAAALRDGAVARDLRALRAEVAQWRLPAAGSSGDSLVRAFERIYRRGRRGQRRVRRSRVGARSDLETMHAWRKRAKDLRYTAEAFDRGDRAKASRRLRRVARRADRVAELLGEEHDLALLAQAVRARRGRRAGDPPKLGRGTRKRLLKLIARRRRRLRRRALREGRELYRHKPPRFVARLRVTPRVE